MSWVANTMDHSLRQASQASCSGRNAELLSYRHRCPAGSYTPIRHSFAFGSSVPVCSRSNRNMPCNTIAANRPVVTSTGSPSSSKAHANGAALPPAGPTICVPEDFKLAPGAVSSVDKMGKGLAADVFRCFGCTRPECQVSSMLCTHADQSCHAWLL